MNGVAALAIANSAMGGLAVAAVLKFADSVRKQTLTSAVLSLWLSLFLCLIQHLNGLVFIFDNCTAGAFAAFWLSCYTIPLSLKKKMLSVFLKVLKGYATAVSVLLTGTLSMVLFGTEMNSTYLLGMINVICSVFLYNAKGLEENTC